MSTLSQFFPPKPSFTEKNVPDQSGKVFLITGSTAGIGHQLARILYSRGATVYVSGRSETKIRDAIDSIRSAYPSSKGRLEGLTVDLADLNSVKSAAEDFLARADKLDVLVHNAGVMRPPKGRTLQGHDLELATNTLGPFLLNRLLEGILKRTAAAGSSDPSRSSNQHPVRVLWLSSLVGVSTLPNGGILFNDDTNAPAIADDPLKHYMQSKVGNVYLAHGAAKRLGGDGVLSLSINPGLLSSELMRHVNLVQRGIMRMMFKPAIYGAYTELYAAVSPELTLENDNGSHIIPWGRKGVLPADVQAEMDGACLASKPCDSTADKSHVNDDKEKKTEKLSERFWEWCERETKEFWQ